MSVKVLTNADNINIANTISAWFQQDYTGDYVELGDIEECGQNYEPTFVDVYSNRFGVQARRARLLTLKEASVNFVLREPNPENLQRLVYGGTITSSQSFNTWESVVLDIEGVDSVGPYVDWSDVNDDSPTSFIGAYLTTDVLREDEFTVNASDPDSAERVHITQSSITLEEDDEVLIVYRKQNTDYYKIPIFGATDLEIVGAGIFQARAIDGGVEQIFEFDSVTLSPNGEFTFPLDSQQTLPMTWSLQERSGSFGNIYTR